MNKISIINCCDEMAYGKQKNLYKMAVTFGEYLPVINTGDGIYFTLNNCPACGKKVRVEETQEKEPAKPVDWRDEKGSPKRIDFPVKTQGMDKTAYSYFPMGERCLEFTWGSAVVRFTETEFKKIVEVFYLGVENAN